MMLVAKLTATVAADFVKNNADTTFGSDSGTQPTYDFDQNSVIVKVPTPTDDNHAVNKQYVDTAMQGIDEVLTPVKAATQKGATAPDYFNNIDLAFDAANPLISGTTIDDVSLSVGDRVLVKNQTIASENGVYVVGNVGVGGTPGRPIKLLQHVLQIWLQVIKQMLFSSLLKKELKMKIADLFVRVQLQMTQ